MKKYRAVCYPSVDEFDCGEVEANSLEEAKEMLQDISDMNYGFPVLDSDIEEVDEDAN